MPWNTPPPLLHLPDADAYRQHYISKLYNVSVETFDGIHVGFAYRGFDHAFFKSLNRRAKDKSVFDQERAERMDWIPWALANPTCLIKQAWRSEWKAFDPTRRVCITPVDYCVWIEVPAGRRPFFVTAFIPEPTNLVKLKASPDWLKKMTALLVLARRSEPLLIPSR
jgi:hypothetical protein